MIARIKEDRIVDYVRRFGPVTTQQIVQAFGTSSQLAQRLKRIRRIRCINPEEGGGGQIGFKWEYIDQGGDDE